MWATPLPARPGAAQRAARQHRRSARYLERDDDHEDLLVFVGKDVLDERPAGADERDGDEQQGPFQAAKGGGQTRVGLVGSPPLQVQFHRSGYGFTCFLQKTGGHTQEVHLK